MQENHPLYQTMAGNHEKGSIPFQETCPDNITDHGGHEYIIQMEVLVLQNILCIEVSGKSARKDMMTHMEAAPGTVLGQDDDAGRIQ
jgi:hypothetical protein